MKEKEITSERKTEDIKKRKRRTTKKTRKQEYIHMTRESMTVLFSHSQYRMIQNVQPLSDRKR
jgi:hypothetical protein